jgi:hypothetical protein
MTQPRQTPPAPGGPAAPRPPDPNARGKGIAAGVIILLALLGGGVLCALSALGHKDRAPTAMRADEAAAAEDRWVQVEGHVVADSMTFQDSVLDQDLAAFQLAESGDRLTVLVATKGPWAFLEEKALWEQSLLAKLLPPERRPLSPRAREFLVEPQRFEGLVVHPGHGMEKPGEVSLDDSRFDMNGLLHGYCYAKGHHCGTPGNVLLVGEKPGGRTLPWLGLVACALLSALFLAAVVSMIRKPSAA